MLQPGLSSSNQKRLQRHQLVQRRREVIAASNRFGETQHRITLTIGIAKHAQQLLLNVMQTCAVSAEVQTVRAAGCAVWQTLTNNLQPFAIFFQINAGQVRGFSSPNCCVNIKSSPI